MSTDSVTLYPQHAEPLTIEQIEQLAEGAEVHVADDGAVMIAWDDVSIELRFFPQGDVLVDDLAEFRKFVRDRSGSDDEASGLIEEINRTEMLVDCEVSPGFDQDNKAKSFVVSMAVSFERCLLLSDGAVFSPFGELWFGPHGTEPFGNLEDLRVRKLPLVDFPTMSDDQKERFERVGKQLETRGVPELMKRSWVPDAEQVELRSPEEIAQRAFALHAVICIARGRPREEAMQELREAGAEAWLTPLEAEFLANEDPSEEQRGGMIWKLEALWTLMWALHHIEAFSWPNDMCDVDGLHELVFEKAKDAALFVSQAQCRTKECLLDTTQLVVQLQAVLRSAMIDEEPIPSNLDWNHPAESVLVYECPAHAVVTERHLALNWLIRHGGADWDDVDVPTVPFAVG